jgi:hypothetical protein
MGIKIVAKIAFNKNGNEMVMKITYDKLIVYKYVMLMKITYNKIKS